MSPHYFISGKPEKIVPRIVNELIDLYFNENKNIMQWSDKNLLKPIDCSLRMIVMVHEIDQTGVV